MYDKNPKKSRITVLLEEIRKECDMEDADVWIPE